MVEDKERQNARNRLMETKMFTRYEIQRILDCSLGYTPGEIIFTCRVILHYDLNGFEMDAIITTFQGN